ncbi:MAG: hypothetical protein JWO94_3446 [Verrucomicrobiaceae bacterium]|nr:hypothetical protein [Verrucomicrobiaceae bacterium]
MHASTVFYVTAASGHSCEEGCGTVADGASPNAVRAILSMAVRMTGAQGAILTRVSGHTHQPLISIDLSRPLVAGITRQMSHWRMSVRGTSNHLLQFRATNPMFALCTALKSVPQLPLVLSFIMTAENHLDRCTLEDVEGVAAGLADLLAPAQPARPPVLRGVEVPLPTCCVCDEVQNDRGQWLPWQRFVQEAEGRMLSHTFCPHCLLQNYPELTEGV